MDLGPENNGPARIRRKAYLITLARVLLQTITGNPLLTDPSTLDRQAILDAVRNAVDFPALGVGGGRPSGRQESPIEKIVVFREKHQDGAFHFHVGVLLVCALGFTTAKRALLVRHGLVSHWSSTHSEWWSIVRYGYVPIPPKQAQADLDPQPLTWAKPGVPVDLHEDSQEPFNACAWRGRREKRELEAADQGKQSKFTKLDLQAVILSKGLKTKEAVLAYAGSHG